MPSTLLQFDGQPLETAVKRFSRLSSSDVLACPANALEMGLGLASPPMLTACVATPRSLTGFLGRGIVGILLTSAWHGLLQAKLHPTGVYVLYVFYQFEFSEGFK